MSGDRQTVGTLGFDPAPQFAVHEVEQVHATGVVLTGRCYFEPIRLGTEFTQTAHRQHQETLRTTSCSLLVDSIQMFGHYLAASARVTAPDSGW